MNAWRRNDCPYCIHFHLSLEFRLSGGLQNRFSRRKAELQRIP